MPPGHIFAHRGGRHFIVADRAHHPAPGAVQRTLERKDDHGKHKAEHSGIKELDPDGRRGDRVKAPATYRIKIHGVLLQIDFVGNGPRAGQVDDVFHPAGQPILILHDRYGDLGDAKGGDGKVIRPQAKGGLADTPGGSGCQQAPDGPSHQRGQAKPADVAGELGVDRLGRGDAGVKDRAEQKETADHDRRDADRAQPPFGKPAPGEDGGHHRQRAKHERQKDAKPARLPILGIGSGRDQHDRKTAKRGKAHGPDRKQARIAPLHVHPKGGDGAQKCGVQDRQGQVPALQKAGAQIQARDQCKEGQIAGVHRDFPLKRPVGMNKRTMIRIVKLTANL